MKLFLFLLCLSCPLLAPAAEVNLPDNVKNVCVLVRSTIGDPGSGGPYGTGTGTGFFIASDLVLTANHLTNIPMGPQVMPAEKLSVETRKGHFVSARIVGRDTEHDLALLKVSEPSSTKPLKITDFSLQRGDKVAIVGNFPEAVRVTRGELMMRSLMEGFAMSSAKVRSGFSGGPILCQDGSCQGVLSQRDDANNSIFVRSDTIKRLVRAYEQRSGRKVLTTDANDDTQAAEASSAKSSSPKSAKSGRISGKQTSDVFANPQAAGESVYALPIRKN